jgi:HK97 family phage prohead protease
MTDERFPYAARHWTQDVSIREVDGSGRTIFGTVVPYGEVATVNDGAGPYRESFEPGSFTRSIDQAGKKIPLYPQHNRRELPIARGADWQDTPNGLDGAFPIPRTRAGDDVLVLVEEGIVDSFSVGFRGIKARTDQGVTVRTEAALLEVSLVAQPAYAGASIGGVRSADLTDDLLAEFVESLDPAVREALVHLLVPASGTDGSPDATASPAWHGRTTAADAYLRLRDFTI